MNRSSHAITGSPGGQFSAARGSDGRFRVTCDGLPKQEFIADSERDALNAAQRAYQDAVTKGEIGSSL